MTTASATAGTGPELDQRDDTRETPVRDPHGPRVEASGPDWTADHNGPSIPVADPGADQSPGPSAPRRPHLRSSKRRVGLSKASRTRTSSATISLTSAPSYGASLRTVDAAYDTWGLRRR